MSASLPDALRARFQRLIEEGLSGRAEALRLNLSQASAARWGLAIRHIGQARAAPQDRPRGKGELKPHRAFFSAVIAQDGDVSIPALAAALHDATDVQAHPKAIGKVVRELGYTQK
ncbi:MAG: transposase [Pseudomonadota bacterium]